jgi:hypothetical protein
MSQITLTQILAGIQSLPPEDLAKLREILNAPTSEGERVESVRAGACAASLRDSSADFKWLKEHRREYAGQWVALKDGQLISHGPVAKDVFAAAKSAGHLDAMVTLVEPEPPADMKIINLG